jgi:hypothetical protein
VSVTGPWTWNGGTITFVTPWYSPNIAGGAELQCRRTAEELHARGVPIEVWSTTAGGLMTDWTAPAFAVGPDVINGVPVRRFPVRVASALYSAILDKIAQQDNNVFAGRAKTTLPEKLLLTFKTLKIKRRG